MCFFVHFCAIANDGFIMSYCISVELLTNQQHWNIQLLFWSSQTWPVRRRSDWRRNRGRHVRTALSRMKSGRRGAEIFYITVLFCIVFSFFNETITVYYCFLFPHNHFGVRFFQKLLQLLLILKNHSQKMGSPSNSVFQSQIFWWTCWQIPCKM